MREDNVVYLVLKKIRSRKEDLKEVIAAGLPSFDQYLKAVGEYKAYIIIEQEIQDLQNEEKDD
tara:strand:+ start:143 stop:331 length:189 start_codon:yes stop_codon:yes gene_type:complete